MVTEVQVINHDESEKWEIERMIGKIRGEKAENRRETTSMQMRRYYEDRCMIAFFDRGRGGRRATRSVSLIGASEIACEMERADRETDWRRVKHLHTIERIGEGGGTRQFDVSPVGGKHTSQQLISASMLEIGTSDIHAINQSSTNHAYIRPETSKKRSQRAVLNTTKLRPGPILP